MIEKIKNKIIEYLKTTSLNYEEIGKLVGCSRGPVYSINKQYSIRSFNSSKSRIKPTKECKWCGKDIPGWNCISRPNRYKYCNKLCYTAWQKSDANKGSNNPTWIDGGKHESKMNMLRKGDEWKEWRQAVYIRDNYTCMMCSEVGDRLHPHHIIPKSHNIKLVFDVNNGITLCSHCHQHTKELHSKNSKYQSILQSKIK